MTEKEKRYDTIVDINGIILAGFVGIVGGLYFLIKSFF